jgi:hypothetical protein
MIYIIINGLAISIAAFIGLTIALLWYRKRPSPTALLTLWLANLWLAAILAGALILAPPKGSVWTMTIGSAVVIWAGFVAPAIAGSYQIRRMSFGKIAADSGYWLVTMVAQSILMRLIGLTAPPA